MYTSTLLLLLLTAIASASTGHHKANATRPAQSNRVTAKTSARSDFSHHGYEHHYPHHYGGGHVGGFGGHLGGFGGHYKDLDHYLLPMLLVLGLGVLAMPLLSVFMSSLVGNVPVTTLVSGRRRREANNGQLISEKTIMHLWKKVGKAIEVFTKSDQ